MTDHLFLLLDKVAMLAISYCTRLLDKLYFSKHFFYDLPDKCLIEYYYQDSLVLLIFVESLFKHRIDKKNYLILCMVNENFGFIM